MAEIAIVAKKALKSQYLNATADDFVDDIKRITCLILEEAGRYFFIHKSVQEFFSATYIKSLSEDKVREFYSVCLGRAGVHWAEELTYLASIDFVRHAKAFALPIYQSQLNAVWPAYSKKKPALSDAALRRLLDQFRFEEVATEVQRDGRVLCHIYFTDTMQLAMGRDFFVSGLIDLFFATLGLKYDRNCAIRIHIVETLPNKRRLSSLLRYPNRITSYERIVRQEADKYLTRLFNNWSKINTALRRLEQSEAALGFDPAK